METSSLNQFYSVSLFCSTFFARILDLYSICLSLAFFYKLCIVFSLNLTIISPFLIQGAISVFVFFIVVDVSSKLLSRSSRPELFCKKRVLRNFVKFSGKHLWQSLFYNKVSGLKPVIFLKRETLAQAFSSKSFFVEHFWWLLLFIDNFLRMLLIRYCNLIDLNHIFSAILLRTIFFFFFFF